QEDHRVDVESTSPQLLMEVGGGLLKPIQVTANQSDPLANHVIFNVDEANSLLKTWSLAIRDENGTVQNYGPFVNNQESVSANTILGNRAKGTYVVTMLGESKTGLPVKKESTFNLVRPNEQIENAHRYSILFNFDKTTTLAS